MKEPKYQRLSDGKATTSDDPYRGIWYAASLRCGRWTDDWTSLATASGIPVCPKCGCVGMQITAQQWEKGVADYDAKHPGYAFKVSLAKDQCQSIAAKQIVSDNIKQISRFLPEEQQTTPPAS